MAQGSTVGVDAYERLLSELVVNLGGAAPTSGGMGELIADIVNAVPGFTPQSLSDLALAPTGATAQTYQRDLTNTVAIAETSGVLLMTAIALPANLVVNNINFVTGTTAAISPTHQWAGLYNASRVLLAISADATTTAIPASTALVSPIATVAAGSATSFTTTYAGLYYVGVLVTAGTQPTFAGLTGTATENGLAPILTGTSTTGLTTPSTFPTTAGTITATATSLYAYLT